MHLKISSAEVVCCKYLPRITDKLSIEANSVDPEQTAPIVDPEQTAPIGAVCSGSTLFIMEASWTFQQTRNQKTYVVIGTVKV